VGLAAHSGQVDVRITAKAATADEADRLIAEVEAVLRERIGAHIFGADAETLDGALAEALRTAHARLNITEAGVAPVISARAAALQDEGVLLSGRALADDAALRAETGLPASTPLRELAELAARQVGTKNEQTVSIVAVSREGDALDEADSAERTALAVCLGDEVRSRSYGFGGQADEVRQYLVTWAFAMAWRLLRDAG
jgi:nicotinamide-nucleotide amidase